MEMTFWLQYCISGVLTTVLCVIGFLSNTLTLYILNVNKDMRKQSINIYLTVLALYDNGVLINAILMLGVPSLYLPYIYQNNGIEQLEYGHSNISLAEQNNISMICNKTFVFKDKINVMLNESLIDANKSCDMTSIETNQTYDYSDQTNSETPLHLNPLHHYIRIVYPLALISQTGSIWTTCLITVERYLAICHPLKSLTLSTRSRAIWCLTALSFGALLYNLPRFAEVDIIDESVKQSQLRNDKIYYYLYYICLNLTLIYIIPLSLLSYLNTKIYLAVRSASANRNTLTRHQQRELNLASMLVLLVAIFIACNVPAFVVNVLEILNPASVVVTIMFTNLLVCLNSAVNFLIYCIFGKKFRETLKKVFRCQTQAKRRKCNTNRHYYFGGNPSSYAVDTFV